MKRTDKMAENEKGGRKIIAQNKKAFHDYFIDERYETGIVLSGTEIKSLRAGQVNLKDSYCEIRGGEIFALGIHISPYEQGNIFNRNPLRDRKLLMHRREIMKLIGKTERAGYTLVPLDLHFTRGRVKVTVALARGMREFEKRADESKKEWKREQERIMKKDARGRHDLGG